MFYVARINQDGRCVGGYESPDRHPLQPAEVEIAGPVADVLGKRWTGSEFEIVSAQPNTPGNPYFGKPPKGRGEFWGIVEAIIGGPKMKRLLTDAYSVGVVKVIDSNDLIDVDDTGGNFLRYLQKLTTTKGEDGQLLLDPADADATMAAWK